MSRHQAGFYERFVKRGLDVLCSLLALLCLSPVLLVLTVLGAVRMRGNPFFAQRRPGKDGRIFRLLKFRTMSREVDGKGNPLPDERRLNQYGRFLRSTSLDELPELLNILRGDMSFVGPRPLLVEYLPLYDEEQRHRHDVLPGLTGYAQVNGRNALSWEDRFKLDVEYTRTISFAVDAKIILKTVMAVLRREGIQGEGCATMKPFAGAQTLK